MVATEDNFKYRLEKYHANKNINIHDKHILSLYYTDSNGFSCILAYLYINSFTENIDYICAGNNIISRDGSYMPNFIKMEETNNIPVNLLDKTKIFLSKYKDRLKISVSYVDVNIGDVNKDNYDNLYLFSLYMIISYYSLESKDTDTTQYERLEEINSIKKEWVLGVIYSLNIKSNAGDLLKSSIQMYGQKISPDGYYYDDNGLIAYRDFSNEIHINYIMSKETFKKKTPAYSILMEYVSLSGVNYNIWDNDSIKNKLYESSKLNKKSSSRKIFIMVNEYCGNTLIDYYKTNKNIIGNLKEDPDSVNYFVFQVIHAVSILHEKGYVHGDLHVNNITIRKTHKTKKVGVQSNDTVMYKNPIDDKLCYIINFYGAYASIIDFGRSVSTRKLKDHKVYFYEKIKSVVDKKFNIGIDLDIYIKCCMMLDVYKFIESYYYLSTLENCKTSKNILQVKKKLVMFMEELIEGKHDIKKNSNVCMFFIKESNLFSKLSMNKDNISDMDSFVDIF